MWNNGSLQTLLIECKMQYYNLLDKLSSVLKWLNSTFNHDKQKLETKQKSTHRNANKLCRLHKVGHHSTIKSDILLTSASVQRGSIPRRKELDTEFYAEEMKSQENQSILQLLPVSSTDSWKRGRSGPSETSETAGNVSILIGICQS